MQRIPVQLATQPYDIQSGCDLKGPEERGELLQTIKKQRPRLVIVAFPCKLWCRWQEMEVAKGGQEYRRRLRRHGRPGERDPDPRASTAGCRARVGASQIVLRPRAGPRADTKPWRAGSGARRTDSLAARPVSL